jgi:hypothetical protein
MAMTVLLVLLVLVGLLGRTRVFLVLLGLLVVLVLIRRWLVLRGLLVSLWLVLLVRPAHLVRRARMVWTALTVPMVRMVARSSRSVVL